SFVTDQGRRYVFPMSRLGDEWKQTARKSRISWIVRLAFVVVLCRPISPSVGAAYGERWDFLGEVHIDAEKDRDDILVERRDGGFRALRLRLSDEGEVFFERIVVHYADGSTEELAIRDRILAGSQTPTLDLHGEPRTIETVELWHFRPSGEHPP